MFMMNLNQICRKGIHFAENLSKVDVVDALTTIELEVWCIMPHILTSQRLQTATPGTRRQLEREPERKRQPGDQWPQWAQWQLECIPLHQVPNLPMAPALSPLLPHPHRPLQPQWRTLIGSSLHQWSSGDHDPTLIDKIQTVLRNP